MHRLREDKFWKRADFVFDRRSFRLLYEAFGDFIVGRMMGLRFFIKVSRRYSAWMFL